MRDPKQIDVLISGGTRESRRWLMAELQSQLDSLHLKYRCADTDRTPFSDLEKGLDELASPGAVVVIEDGGPY